MNKSIFVLITLLSVITLGCKKPPVACMEISETSVSAGTPVIFTSCAEKALSYEWFIEGPEGAPENEQGWSDESFTNTFTVIGTYTVTFNAYENFSFLGRVSTVEETISIN